VDNLDLSVAGLGADNWLCIAGVDADTRVQVHVGKSGQSPDFEFDTGDLKNGWGNSDPDVAKDTGDGTVPLRAAIPKFLPPNSVVCVKPADFDLLGEIGDRLLLKAAGFHGMLPNLNMAQRLIVNFFAGRSDPRGTTWGRRVPGVTGIWRPPPPLDTITERPP
jgi:hypothetical protein